MNVQEVSKALLQSEEFQMFSSAVIVRQAQRLPLPKELVDYHTGILETAGIDLNRIRFATSEELGPVLGEVLQVRRTSNLL